MFQYDEPASPARHQFLAFITSHYLDLGRKENIVREGQDIKDIRNHFKLLTLVLVSMTPNMMYYMQHKIIVMYICCTNVYEHFFLSWVKYQSYR